LRVLLINPYYTEDFCKSARWAAKSRGRVQRHPDWMAYATSVLEHDGHQCSLFDAQAENQSLTTELRRMISFEPDMVVIWTTTPSIYSDITFTRFVKHSFPKCLTVAVGAHPTALPEETLKIDSCLDVVCVGEFDYTLRDLANYDSPENVEGIVWRNGEEIVRNKPRPLIQDLDSMPFPAWRHINPRIYYDAGKRNPFVTLISSRGCSHFCTFCRERHTIEPGKIRYRSAMSLVKEIHNDLRLFPYLKEIMIEDDTFPTDLNRVNEFCELMLKYKFKISWSCNSRADITDLDTLKNMKKAGCRWVCVGYESGNQEILDNIHKGVKLDTMYQFTELAKEAGLQINGCFMFGLMGESPETAQETIDFALELNPTMVQFSACVPYPGTPFYDWCKKNNYIVAKDWNEWVDENYEQKSIVSYPNFSKEQIDFYVDKGLRDFYSSWKRRLNLLKTIQSFSDLRRVYYGWKSYRNYFGCRT